MYCNFMPVLSCLVSFGMVVTAMRFWRSNTSQPLLINLVFSYVLRGPRRCAHNCPHAT